MTIEHVEGEEATDIFVEVVNLDPYQLLHSYVNDNGLSLGEYSIYELTVSDGTRYVVQQRVVNDGGEKRGFIELSVQPPVVHRAEGLLEQYDDSGSLEETVYLTPSDSGFVRTTRTSYRCR